MRRLGLDFQSAFGMPPVDYIGLAADLGCGHVTAAPTSLPWNPCSFPAWSLRDDPRLRAETRAALADRGIVVSAVYGFSIKPGHDVRALAADADIAAELGTVA